MAETLIADIETNGLLGPGLTTLHLIQIGTADGTDVTLYADLPAHQVADVAARGLLQSPLRPLAEGVARLKAAERYVFHNGLTFDMPALNQFHPGTLVQEKMWDTLVLARLAEPDQRQHSLKAWGERLGLAKGEYKGDFQTVDDEFLVYAERDIEVGRKLFHAVKHVLEWGESSDLEHSFAHAMWLQETNGWLLNVKGAEALAADLRGEVEDITKRLQAVFPPLERTETFLPKRDNKTLGYKANVPFIKRHMETFNVGSRRQCAERMMLLGWKPPAMNDDGTIPMDEKVLAGIPYPQARELERYFKTTKLLGAISDGKQGWLKHVKPTGRVHGRVNPNGAVTGRCSHSSPNLANVSGDKRARSLWLPRAGWKLVGCDAEGLEARVLSHYLAAWDGGNYSRIVLEGSSDNRTDVHSLNIQACVRLGMLPKTVWEDPRLFKIARSGTPGIKTLLYALLFGAMDMKLGETFSGMAKELGIRLPALAHRERGALFRKAISTALVGFDKLTLAVQGRAEQRKYLIGLDGRHIHVRRKNSALNSLVQGGGAACMKRALVIFMDAMDARGYPHGASWALCGNIHDEIVAEAAPQIADEVAALLADSIRLAGSHFALRCPLTGKAAIGANWSETH